MTEYIVHLYSTVRRAVSVRAEGIRSAITEAVRVVIANPRSVVVSTDIENDFHDDAVVDEVLSRDTDGIPELHYHGAHPIETPELEAVTQIDTPSGPLSVGVAVTHKPQPASLLHFGLGKLQLLSWNINGGHVAGITAKRVTAERPVGESIPVTRENDMLQLDEPDTVTMIFHNKAGLEVLQNAVNTCLAAMAEYEQQQPPTVT